jgi:hypothetical protein
MVSPVYWALMPISIKPEKCVGTTLTCREAKNLPISRVVTWFDALLKENSIGAGLFLEPKSERLGDDVLLSERSLPPQLPIQRYTEQPGG